MQFLHDVLQQYELANPDETKGLAQFRNLLTNTQTKDRLISRTNFVGHLTASAILIWRSKSQVLLTRHSGLSDFYQPGGHLNNADESPLEAARRHLKYALGDSLFEHFSTEFDPHVPIDIDTHSIPEVNGEDQHYHHDFRYLFFLNESALPNLNRAETHWENVSELMRRQTFRNLVPKILRAQAEHQPKVFFDEVSRPLRQLPKASCVTVAHLIPDIFPYLKTLRGAFNLHAVIPKPRSIDAKVEEEVRRSCNVCPFSREQIVSGLLVSDVLSKIANRFVLIDIGGYFAPVAHSIAERFGSQFVGIVEDTENGHAKYEKISEENPLPIPVISVARSPLKDNEDFLVGQSILFSADFVLRQVGQLIQYLKCGVIGYGKIGSSIAHHLLLRGIKPWVCDNNPIRRARAVNQLCLAPSIDYMIRNADVLFSATGNHALDIHLFRKLKSGCFLFSVTSSEDELDLVFLDGEYECEEIAPHITKYSSFTNYFYLVNKGNAVNFIHNAVLGNAIHLVRGEMIHAAWYLLSGKAQPGLAELPSDKVKPDEDERRKVVEKWLRVFVDQTAL
jgi:adenosylhomocysteinase